MEVDAFPFASVVVQVPDRPQNPQGANPICNVLSVVLTCANHYLTDSSVEQWVFIPESLCLNMFGYMCAHRLLDGNGFSA